MIEIANRLDRADLSESLFVEHSSNWCDYRHLYDALEHIQQTDLLPPPDSRASTLHLFRYHLTKGHDDHKLTSLYAMAFPDSTLRFEAHTAEVDAFKLMQLMHMVYENCSSFGVKPIVASEPTGTTVQSAEASVLAPLSVNVQRKRRNVDHDIRTMLG